MTTGTIITNPGVRDPRAVGALPDASGEVADLWARVTGMTAGGLPGMGLAAGDRPTADVEVLAGALAAVEYELARRMHAAATAGALPLTGPGAVLAARGWAGPYARRLARCGALAADHPTVAAAWAAGIITSDHVDAVARNSGPLTPDELVAVIAELADRWGTWPPAQIAQLVTAAARLLHPPPDPTRDETDAHTARDLSFALLGDTVLLTGTLPRLEGEAVITAIDALAERLRSTADHTPAGARRADALIELVNTAHTTGGLPTRGGLPVALTVTLDHTTLGDPVWTTSRGHLLTHAEARFAACDPTITPIALTTPGSTGGGGLNGGPGCDGAASGPGGRASGGSGASPLGRPGGPRGPAGPGDPGEPGDPRGPGGPGGPVGVGGWALGATPGIPTPDPARAPTPGDRIAALAALMFDGPRIPLAVGRTARTATPAQRKALAARDHGCVIPGCGVPADNCQAHHLTDWAADGRTDIDNLALLCWSHHRQVDLGMWTIQPAEPSAARADPRPTGTPAGPPAGPPEGPPATEARWPGNNGSPWIISRTHRTRWRQ